MLTALHHAIDLAAEHKDLEVDLAQLDLADPEVYEMLCRGDSVGVFQVESRAQMATLPRLRPRTFYDLVVEVALIRPGPIQGGSVHPYIRRRNGLEKAVFDHPALEAVLGRTLGIPLFQGHTAVVLVATVVLTIPVAAISYALVEDPARRWVGRTWATKTAAMETTHNS